MTNRGKKLGDILMQLGVIDADQMKAAIEYGKRWGLPFGQACVKMGFCEEATVVQALAQQMGAPSVSLAGVTPAPEVLAKISPSQAEAYRVIPISIVPGAGKGTLVVAVSSPKELRVMDELAFITGHRVSPVIASDSEIDEALFRLYGRDVQRHTKSSTMVDLEIEAFQSSEGGEMDVVHDPLRLALDFLPVVSLSR